MPKKHKHNTLRDRFCRCIKAVRTTIKPQNITNTRTRRNKTGMSAVTAKAKAKAKAKESAAIAICIRSVLGARGKTLRKFSCRKKQLQTTKIPSTNN